MMIQLLALLHVLLAFWLTLYGLNSLVLVILYLLHRRKAEEAPSVDHAALPPVTVQVPVYNELHVIERVIDHVAALDYPRDRLEIQILDDSTDETSRLARARAALYRERGVNITVLHRSKRDGYKAGALTWGMQQAHGEFIAIFDADFCPPRDFLLQTIPHFLARPRLGVIQTRWTSLNSDYSLLTQAQALVLDGYFVVEQTARSRSGLLMNFNGSGGVWRRRCIEEAGGWQSDTLCEDLDLSYRAQLAGWECLFLPHVEVPTELPPQITAFKHQQERWAQGATQTLRKLAVPILHSRRFNWRQKVMVLIQLSCYVGHLLTVFLLLLSLPLLLLRPDMGQPQVNGLGLASLGPLLLYAIAQQRLYPDWARRLRAVPLLVLIGIGIAWGNTRAIWRGLTRWGGAFVRTPKFRLEGKGGRWLESNYRLRADRAVGGEAALALYALITAAVALVTGHYGVVFFTLLNAAAFGTVAGLSWVQTRGHCQLRPAVLLKAVQRRRLGSKGRP